MAYKISPNNADYIKIPQSIVFKLPELEDDWLRIAIYALAHQCTDEAIIARELHLKKPKCVREAMTYWKGVGIFCTNDDEICLPTIQEPTNVRLTTGEIALASQSDPNITCLVQECQNIMGSVITETDMRELVTLYLCDKIPIDMILIGAAHFAVLGKRSGKYIARALRSWKEQGIFSGEDADNYLKLLETRKSREKRVSQLFGDEKLCFTRADSNAINAWYEDFKFDDSMVAEAIGYAGDKQNAKYVNGILKNWFNSGFKTVRDVQANSANTMQNTVPSLNAGSGDMLKSALGKVPVYKRKSEK